MDNNNQSNINIPEQPPINSIPSSPKKLSKKIIILGAPVLAVIIAIYIIPQYWDVAGGGATIQTAPDSIKAGEATTIKFEVSVPGSKKDISGRYTDVFLYYQTTGQDTLGQLKPKLISQTKDKEIYEFTIPPYPIGTQGEISYYIELKLDGHANRVEGYKKIKVGEYSNINNNNSFKTWDDGTAYVKGEVIDRVSGCEVDGVCKLIVQAGEQKVALVYAEGDIQCLNTQAASWVNWGKNVNKGTIVKAYGVAGRVAGSAGQYALTYELRFCDSKDYFILGADDPVPVGAYTEKFFDEVAKGKSEVQQNQFEEAQKSGKWVNYKNETLSYEFSYPATWSMPQTSLDAPFTIQYHDFSSQNNNWYTITLGFISEAQLATMGIDYCGAYPNDKRCEIKKIGEVVVYIDWGDSNNKSAFTKIPSPKGGIITLTLEPNSSEAKSLFIPILNTFKFIK